MYKGLSAGEHCKKRKKEGGRDREGEGGKRGRRKERKGGEEELETVSMDNFQGIALPKKAKKGAVGEYWPHHFHPHLAFCVLTAHP
jgi:hypothetical protein